MTTDQTSVIDLIKADHQEFKRRFPEVIDATGDDQTKLFEALMHDLVRHEVAEEEIVWPEVRRSIEGGDALADARIEEEAKAEATLKKLDDMEAGTPEFVDLLTTLMNAVVTHAEAEEAQVLSHLADAKNPEELGAMGAWWERAKAMAPTFPHPNAPNSATAHVVGGPALSLVDHLREVFRNARQ